MSIVIQISYFAAMLSFVLGLKFLSSPVKAKKGNIISAFGMILAIVVTIINGFLGEAISLNLILIFIAIVLATVIGKRMSDKVEMTAMPQLVSYFNAMGGGCALLLGIIEAQQINVMESNRLAEITLMAGMMIGSIAFSGSIVAYLKLAGKQKDRRSYLIAYTSKILLFSLVIIPVAVSLQWFSLSLVEEVLILAALSLVYGIVFVLPIGGADMPVVISLLNALTGIATALAGLMYGNLIMISGGIFVGAAGLLLTLMMCKAMNRSLWKVLAGKFKKSKGISIEEDIEIQPTTIGETATKLAFASKVAIIPGYGLAVAQAQHLCSQLEMILEENGISVDYIIHPVAGRMPGHMNVLLAEADVHYDKLREMEEVNDKMGEYDVALIIGANDVVNPSAELDVDSSIYGMPIIKAYNAKNIVVIKRGMGKGYAGVENKLFGYSNCHLLFSDAKKALLDLINELKNLNQ